MNAGAQGVVVGAHAVLGHEHRHAGDLVARTRTAPAQRVGLDRACPSR